MIWRELMMNEQVINGVQKDQCFLKWIRQRRVQLRDHVLRHENLLEKIRGGVVDGKNWQGRRGLEYNKH
jgi:hypothetical protein